jgi:hypothetical protein
VLFVDVLGTSAMASSPNALQHLRELRPALERAAERSMVNDSGLLQASTWFTDNLVVATPIVGPIESEQALGWLEVSSAYLLLILAERGFLARGALAFGPHYMDEQFVFGPALIEAVEHEKSGRWPRVVLSPTAVAAERYHLSAYYGGGPHAMQRSCLLCDEEGVTFVDHLGIYIDEEDDAAVLEWFLHRHRAAIATGLADHAPQTEVHAKWSWLADYHNHTVQSRMRDPQPYVVNVSAPRHRFGPFAPDIAEIPVRDALS